MLKFLTSKQKSDRKYYIKNRSRIIKRCNISRSNNFTSVEWKVTINAYLKLGGK